MIIGWLKLAKLPQAPGRAAAVGGLQVVRCAQASTQRLPQLSRAPAAATAASAATTSTAATAATAAARLRPPLGLAPGLGLQHWTKTKGHVSGEGGGCCGMASRT